VADGEGICWREWLASRITTGRVIRGGCSRWGGRVRLGWGMDDGEARRRARPGGWRGVAWRGAVRCGAVRCGAVRRGAARCGAVRCGVVWVCARAAHTVALDEKCSQRATAAGKFTRITRAKLNGEG